MFKRVLGSVLWFMAAWELGSAIGLLIGLQGDLLPAVLALIAASFAGLDPLHALQVRRSGATARVSQATQAHTL